MIIAVILLSVWLLFAMIALLVLLYDTSYRIGDIATVLLFVFMPPIWAIGKMIEKIIKKYEEHKRKQKRRELYKAEKDDDRE